MKTPLWAVVPAKTLLRGKSRLRSVLADPERERFAAHLLCHTIDVLGACAFDGVLVATDGDDVAAIARARGAEVRRDQGERSLAAVVDAALADVARRGARSAVVLMADLPCVEPGDVRALASALTGRDAAIVRDHAGHHTNALALAPPTAIATCFGQADSFEAHCSAFVAAGVLWTVVDNERIAFDVDGPADHRRFTSMRAPA